MERLAASSLTRVLVLTTWLIVAMSGPVLEVVAPATTDAADWQWPIGLLSFAPAAFIILLRRPGNRIGLLLAVTASAAGVIFIGGWASGIASTELAAVLFEHLANIGLFVSFWGLISLLYVFPNGRAGSRPWRTAYRLFSFVLLVVVPILFVLRPGAMDISGRPNPLGVDVSWLPGFLDAAVVILPLGTVGGVVSLVLRIRRAGGVERAQLKVFVLGSIAVVGLMAIIGLIPEDVDPVIDAALRPLVIIGFWALPASIVAAILRYRLYDIDRVVSRTATYLIVIVMLGFGYVTSLVILQTLLPLEGTVPVAVSTLVMVSASTPLRRRVQRSVDRRFFRSRFDSQEVVTAFSTVVRSNVDLDELTSHLTNVVATTLEPGHLSIWIPERS